MGVVGPCASAQHAAVDRTGPLQGGADASRESDRVVVARVDLDPGERPAVLAARELGEDRRLPVAAGGDDQRNGRAGGRSEPVEDVRFRQRAVSDRRWPELRLGEERQALTPFPGCQLAVLAYAVGSVADPIRPSCSAR
jgi:hypothetical protein